MPGPLAVLGASIARGMMTRLAGPGSRGLGAGGMQAYGQGGARGLAGQLTRNAAGQAAGTAGAAFGSGSGGADAAGRGATAGAIGSLLKADLAGFVKGIEDAKRALIEHARNLAKFNSQIAGSQVELERGRLRRQIGEAQRNAGSYSALTKSQNRLEDAIQPFKERFNAVAVDLATAITRIEEAVVKAASKFLEEAPKERDKKKAEDVIPAVGILRALAGQPQMQQPLANLQRPDAPPRVQPVRMIDLEDRMARAMAREAADPPRPRKPNK